MPRIVKSRHPLPDGGALKRLQNPPVNGNTLQRRYDWTAIRHRYVSSDALLTAKELAREFGANIGTLRVKMSKERWPYLRVAEQQKIHKKRMAARQKKLVEQGVEFDDLSANTAKMGLALVTGRLAQISAEFGATQATHKANLERLQRGEPVDHRDLWSVINYKELDVLARAALSFQDMGRKALGTDVARVDISGDLEHHVDVDVSGEISIREELSKDDPERLAQMLEVMERSGLVSFNALADDSNVIEGESELVEATTIPGTP